MALQPVKCRNCCDWVVSLRPCLWNSLLAARDFHGWHLWVGGSPKRTHPSMRLAIPELLFAVVRDLQLNLPSFFFFFFLCRCELWCMFERKLPRTTLQVLNLLRLWPVRVVLRERRHDDETHHRAPHAVYINPGRLRWVPHWSVLDVCLASRPTERAVCWLTAMPPLPLFADLYYGGDTFSVEQPQSFTCPYCGKMGFTETSLQEHVTTEHAETSTEVVSMPHTDHSAGKGEMGARQWLVARETCELMVIISTRGHRLFGEHRFVSLQLNQTDCFSICVQRDPPWCTAAGLDGCCKLLLVVGVWSLSCRHHTLPGEHAK